MRRKATETPYSPRLGLQDITIDRMVTVEIPSALRPCCDGQTQICVDASTVRAVLDQLEADYPELHRSVCNETGAVRRHMNLFVNSELLPENPGLDLSLDDGDVVHIFTAVSGG